jgi:Homeobox KN domain
MVNTRATRTNAALRSAIPEPEFLAYEPLEEDFLPLSPMPCEDEQQDWCATMTAVGEPGPMASSGLYDPFTALWDRVPARSVNVLPHGRDTVDSHFVAQSKPPPPHVVQLDSSTVDSRSGLRKKRVGDDLDALCNDDEPTGTRNLCPRATRILKEWMTSPEHFDHPYPDEKEKLELAAKAGITTKQLTIWFTNARKRLWVPMRKRQVWDLGCGFVGRHACGSVNRLVLCRVCQSLVLRSTAPSRRSATLKNSNVG